MTKYIYNESQFPEQVWDGTTGGHNDADRAELRPRIPDGTDWDQIVAEVIATQEYVVTIAGIVGVDKYSWLKKPTAPNQLLVSPSAGAANWVALPSVLVPYTGATSDVDLGSFGLTTTDLTATDSVSLATDDGRAYFGADDDASIYYDGTNLVVNPKEVGSGILDVAGTLQVDSSLGVGSLASAPARLFHIATETSLTNDQIYAWRLEHRTTGVPTTGFGVNYEYYLHNSDNELVEAGVQQVSWSDATAGSEDVRFSWVGKKAGARLSLMALDAGTNELTVYADARFAASGTRTVTIARDGGTTLQLQTSVLASGAYIRTTTESPLTLGSNSTSILVLTAGHAYLRADNRKLYFGAADDASIFYDGGNLIINTHEVGSGNLYLNGSFYVLQGEATCYLMRTTTQGISFTTNAGGNTITGINAGKQFILYGQGGIVLRSDTDTLIDCDYNGDGASRIRLRQGTSDCLVIDENKHVQVPVDNRKLLFGSGQDASIYYDGTNLVVNPAEVGAGGLDVHNAAGSGVINIGTWGTASGVGAGTSGFGSNFYTAGDRKFYYTNTHASIGAAGLLTNWTSGGATVSLFSQGQGATKNAEFTPNIALMVDTTNRVVIYTLLCQNDNIRHYFGDSNDASIYYDGLNLVVNPAEVGSGVLDVAGTLQTDGYNAADGTAGATADVAVAAVGGGTRTLHFKNGLYTGYTDS